jgi:D-glucuronyl C5-epimerase C-terminus
MSWTGAEAATIRQGLTNAAATGRLSSLSAARHNATLARATRALEQMPLQRGVILFAVLRDVARQASTFNEPRSRALFGMLDANTRYLQTRGAIAERKDILDADGVVYRYYAGHGFQFQPLANFARLNAAVSAGRALTAERLARALVARGIPQRGALYWEYYFPFGGPSRWNSGFVQAVAAQALARAGDLVVDPSLEGAAYAAFRAIQQSFLMPLGRGSWIREYGFTDMAILNAQLQSLVSLYSFAALNGAADVRRTVARLDLASRTLLSQFDTGCWSRYSLGGRLASRHYHEYHVWLLRRLAAMRGDRIWRSTAARWSNFLRSAPC